MTLDRRPWKATIAILRPTVPSADRLARALRPEAAREVPRSRATLRRPSPKGVEIVVRATDTGALRAAMNAHLGWVRIALEAEAVAMEATRQPAEQND